jgi:pimeloyl-ACP methyl ester carboxylesterase
MRASANGIEIEYEIHGPSDGRPLLLIMGLASQLVHWDDAFCAMLAERGHRVIRFDNRDVGRSSHLHAAGMPNVLAGFAAAARGDDVTAAYTLSDMAADAAGLLDVLGIPAAHVVGASMGGMIAQTIAIEHPSRVKTLTSIMSTTGARDLPPAEPKAMAVLVTPVPTDRDASIARSVEVFRTIGSTGFPFDEDRVRARATLAYDRGFNPQGVARRTAILARRAADGRSSATSAFRRARDPWHRRSRWSRFRAASTGGFDHRRPRSGSRVWDTFRAAPGRHRRRVTRLTSEHG